MSADGGKAQPEAAPKSKLNPFAREFKLNVNAPSFTPAGKPAKLQGSAPPSGGATQGAAPVPAPSLPLSQPSAGPGPGYRPYPCSYAHCCLRCVTHAASLQCITYMLPLSLVHTLLL